MSYLLDKRTNKQAHTQTIKQTNATESITSPNSSVEVMNTTLTGVIGQVWSGLGVGAVGQSGGDY